MWGRKQRTQQYKRHYRQVYGYCFGRLGGDSKGSEACTKKVLRQFSKRLLVLGGDDDEVLFKTAEKVVSDYMKKHNL